MKKMILKVMALIVSVAMSASFTSCGDDNDDNEPDQPQKKIATVVVDYSVALSQDYFDLWDIEVTYTGAGGQPVTEKIDMDWHMQLNLKTFDEIPTTYALTAVAKPKATAPTLVADHVYDITSECKLLITGIAADGKTETTAGTLVPVKKSVSTDGNHLTTSITEQRSICDMKYSITLD